MYPFLFFFGIADISDKILYEIWFVSKFGRQPMHLFGALGVLMFIVGFGFSIYLGIDKIVINPKGRLITDRPQFFIALTAMLIGTQFFLAGFLGEIMVRSRKNDTRYNISDKINV
mgnify:CR=1 FL=1